jgi:hypothetical protein
MAKGLREPPIEVNQVMLRARAKAELGGAFAEFHVQPLEPRLTLRLLAGPLHRH